MKFKSSMAMLFVAVVLIASGCGAGNEKEIAALKKMKDSLVGQNNALKDQIEIEKARGEYGKETYLIQTEVKRNEIEILKLKEKQNELEGK
jgi:regulator of replication initiation timing